MTRIPARLVCAALLAAAPALAQTANPEKNAYFGETHVHTAWSLDAYLFGNRVSGPDESYRYFQGETIKHPLGYDIKIDTPLDWAGVTDHSEYVGIMAEANTPGSAVSKLSAAQPLIVKDWNDKAELARVLQYLIRLVAGKPVPELMDPKIASTAWRKNVAIAERYNRPGKFTAFCSYEFTSQHDFRNLHRNVPAPYSIQNGKILTTLGGTPFELAIYKLSDTHYLARSNEFGYANYQILPKGPANIVSLGKGESQEQEHEQEPPR